jgi:hypothetical protein
MRSFSPYQIGLCLRFAFLPKGNLTFPEWIIALDLIRPSDMLVEAIREATGELAYQPSCFQVIEIVERVHRMEAQTKALLDSVVQSQYNKRKYGFVRGHPDAREHKVNRGRNLGSKSS